MNWLFWIVKSHLKVSFREINNDDDDDDDDDNNNNNNNKNRKVEKILIQMLSLAMYSTSICLETIHKNSCKFKIVLL